MKTLLRWNYCREPRDEGLFTEETRALRCDADDDGVVYFPRRGCLKISPSSVSSSNKLGHNLMRAGGE
jgi:hypothetical protein